MGRNIRGPALARDAGEASRLLRVSQRLLEQLEAYYGELGRAQHGSLDITWWMIWFVAQVRAAWEAAGKVVVTSLEKARFWASHAALDLNARQKKEAAVRRGTTSTCRGGARLNDQPTASPSYTA